MASVKTEGQPEDTERIPNFVFPDIEKELGEIERVAKLYAKGFSERFVRIARESKLSELSEEEWRVLDNTDSFDITLGDWEIVKLHSTAGSQSLHPRDWQMLRSKMKRWEPLDAPIIINARGQLHLVSGNTRLMVARALGIRPQVLSVDIGRLS